MAPVAAIDLPREFGMLLGNMPAEAQAKLHRLHATYNITEFQKECFELNEGSLTADKLPAFESFLRQEAAKSANGKPATGTSRSLQGQGGSGEKKRRRVATPSSLVPSELHGILGMTQGARAADGTSSASTPAKAKVRDAFDVLDAMSMSATSQQEGPSTPHPMATPPKTTLQVSTKSSVNGSVDKPKRQAAGAALKVQLLGDEKLWKGSRHGAYEWMDESIDERVHHQDRHLVAMEQPVMEAMLARHPSTPGEEDREVSAGIVGLPSQSEVVLCGRIACEGLEGRLNERSILLEGSMASSRGASVRLNVVECKSVAAVPGQIVGVLGRPGMSGTTFHARDFIPGLPLEAAVQAQKRTLTDGPIHMMFAAGPYCKRDGLDYSPLQSLLEHAVAERPQVLVLMGPFVDANNSQVMTGSPTLPNESEPCTYEDVYEQIVIPTIARGVRPLRRQGPDGQPATEVIIVPSLEEVLCFHPLPQPPLDASLDLAEGAWQQLVQNGVRLVPNPAHLRIGNLRVSLTSADALTPVAREVVVKPEGKKVEQALRILLAQRGLFPVLPREPAAVCESRAAALDFPGGELPDICVFPSVTGLPTGHFVENSVFVNPGSVCRPAALGQFVEMWLPQHDEATAARPLRETVRMDVKKLE